MARRTVTVRFAEGDAAGVTAVVRVCRGDRLLAELRLTAAKSKTAFDYEIDTREGSGYSYEVEYAWGYAREASRSGKSDADELILPFPGHVSWQDGKA